MPRSPDTSPTASPHRCCTCCPSATWTPTRAIACSVPPQGIERAGRADHSDACRAPGPERIVNVGIVWFRRDLRLADNPAWAAATATCDRVMAVFVVDPQLWDSCHARRRAVLAGNLRSLDDALAARGGRLWVGRGEPVEMLAELIRRAGARAVFANRDVSPYAA
ncbi:MAG: deoxyribodipyrimidine photo-lyase, partial [Acidimicrobiia bacterium]|nr:deoxyribodipyrimidine photo-lyase [Acidimicrobiia bacterium]